ncbi:hypothetical protein SEA_LONELYBOI_12 [Gordonia phage LonelyBoi]|nr:hypothetical protein SEA_LONELYBOI_12 [Gordonia phage LonelyBoi]
MSVRLKFNIDGFYDLRRDPGIVGQEEAIAQQIADRANSIGKGTYALGSRQGRKAPQGRWRTTVVTADARAMANNARRNTLIRAME